MYVLASNKGACTFKQATGGKSARRCMRSSFVARWGTQRLNLHLGPPGCASFIRTRSGCAAFAPALHCEPGRLRNRATGFFRKA